MTDTNRLHIVIGSTREGRAVDRLIPWLLDRTGAHARFEPEIIDLRDWALPMFQETMATVGDFNDPTYSTPIVREWNRKISEGDAFLFVTPEYNHSVPGELKNAIDNLFVSFALRNKPAAFVGYSASPVGAARAVEHLAHITIEAEMAPLRNTVLIGLVQNAFTTEGTPVNPMTDAALGVALDDLAWWSDVLKPARAAGELAPGTFRMQAAMMAAAGS